jgi:hypothetical protein
MFSLFLFACFIVEVFFIGKQALREKKILKYFCEIKNYLKS